MMFGPFCRPESSGQRREDALRLARAGEIRGQAHPANPARPCIRAYSRPLHGGERGVVFTTPVEHDSRFSAPHEVRWYATLTPHVTQAQDDGGHRIAAIVAGVTNLQP